MTAQYDSGAKSRIVSTQARVLSVMSPIGRGPYPESRLLAGLAFRTIAHGFN
jgi:hypothetical protein